MDISVEGEYTYIICCVKFEALEKIPKQRFTEKLVSGNSGNDPNVITDERVATVWQVHTVDYHSAVKRDEVLTRPAARRSPESSAGPSPLQGSASYGMNPTHATCPEEKPRRWGVGWWFQGLGRGWGVSAGSQASFLRWQNVLGLDIGGGCKKHGILCFKGSIL